MQIFQPFSGNSLPHSLYAAATVEHDDTFVIIGGKGGTSSGSWTASDKIYKYDKGGSQLVEVLTTLSEEKPYLTAIKVKPSIFNSC